MAKCSANITLSLDLSLLVTVEALLDSSANAMYGQKVIGSTDLQVEFENFLESEARSEAYDLLHRFVAFRNRDPWGFRFPPEGMYVCDDAIELDVDMPNDQDLYAGGSVNRSSKIKVVAQGITYTDVRLSDSRDSSVIWGEAEAMALKALAAVNKMIRIEERLPFGWEFENEQKFIIEEIIVRRYPSLWDRINGVRKSVGIPKPKKNESFRK